MVQQYCHIGPEQGPAGWQLVQDNMQVGSKQVFAPANLRAAADNAAYKQLVNGFIQQRMTLRYSGGMVPDVHHILAKVWSAPGTGLGFTGLACHPLHCSWQACVYSTHPGPFGNEAAWSPVCGSPLLLIRLSSTASTCSAARQQSLLTHQLLLSLLSQGGGIFCSPASSQAPAKLRLLYEVSLPALCHSSPITACSNLIMTDLHQCCHLQ